MAAEGDKIDGVVAAEKRKHGRPKGSKDAIKRHRSGCKAKVEGSSSCDSRASLESAQSEADTDFQRPAKKTCSDDIRVYEPIQFLSGPSTHREYTVAPEAMPARHTGGPVVDVLASFAAFAQSHPEIHGPGHSVAKPQSPATDVFESGIESGIETFAAIPASQPEQIAPQHAPAEIATEHWQAAAATTAQVFDWIEEEEEAAPASFGIAEGDPFAVDWDRVKGKIDAVSLKLQQSFCREQRQSTATSGLSTWMLAPFPSRFPAAFADW
eukprot:672229-Rhodomonas_salina.1